MLHRLVEVFFRKVTPEKKMTGKRFQANLIANDSWLIFRQHNKVNFEYYLLGAETTDSNFRRNSFASTKIGALGLTPNGHGLTKK